MKVSVILAILGAALSIAAPTATSPSGYGPTKPEPYGPEHSVDHKPWKRHIDVDLEEATPIKRGEPSKPEPYGPTKSVDHKPWKRHIEEGEIEERSPPEYPEPYGEAPEPYPSGGSYNYERSVPVMEAPEHFEVLTA